MTTCDREVVAALAQAIAQRVGEPRYNFWFAPNTKFFCDDDHLIVGVPNRFFQEWLARTFGDAVRAAAGTVLGRPTPVEFRIDPELFQAARKAQAEVTPGVGLAPPSETTPPPAEPAAGRQAARPKRSRRWRRLADFAVGPCNRLAHASALGVLDAPGTAVNPLVLYGPTGTGKTHLLEGIYAGLRKRHPGWRVYFLTAEEFTNRFVQALRHGKLAALRKHFRECDALLVDDLQFLAGKSATEEEFLHTFDALHADGRQLVMASDCHPRLARNLPPLLIDRLVGGAVWGLQPPDEDTRLQMLRGKAGAGDPRLPDEVLRFMAQQLKGNFRELEGALNSVRHYCRVTGQSPDVDAAREALGDVIRHSVCAVRLAQVDEAVCDALRLERGALQCRGRAWTISHPRMVAMYLARKHTATAHGDIGRYFGGRNHSTVVAAEKKVREWLAGDEALSLGGRSWRVRELVELIERQLLS